MTTAKTFSVTASSPHRTFTIPRPSRAQIDELFTKQSPNLSADPEFPETGWSVERFLLSFSGQENDFAWSFAVKDADPDGPPGCYHTVASEPWSDDAAQARERAKHWLTHGHHQPFEDETRVYFMGVADGQPEAQP